MGVNIGSESKLDCRLKCWGGEVKFPNYWLLVGSDICGSSLAAITDKWEGLGLLVTAITPNIQPDHHTTD